MDVRITWASYTLSASINTFLAQDKERKALGVFRQPACLYTCQSICSNRIAGENRRTGHGHIRIAVKRLMPGPAIIVVTGSAAIIRPAMVIAGPAAVIWTAGCGDTGEADGRDNTGQGEAAFSGSKIVIPLGKFRGFPFVVGKGIHKGASL